MDVSVLEKAEEFATNCLGVSSANIVERFHTGPRHSTFIHDLCFAERILYFANKENVNRSKLLLGIKSNIRHPDGLLHFDIRDIRFKLVRAYFYARYDRKLVKEAMRANFRQALVALYKENTDIPADCSKVARILFADIKFNEDDSNFWHLFSQVSHVHCVKNILQEHGHSTTDWYQAELDEITEKLVNKFKIHRSTSPVALINQMMKLISLFEWSNLSHQTYENLNFSKSDYTEPLYSSSFDDACAVLNYIYVIYNGYMRYENKIDFHFCTEAASRLKEIIISRQNNDGGFSFNATKKKYTYLGVLRKEENLWQESDLHGTAMYVWAYQLCSEILSKNHEFVFLH